MPVEAGQIHRAQTGAIDRNDLTGSCGILVRYQPTDNTVFNTVFDRACSAATRVHRENSGSCRCYLYAQRSRAGTRGHLNLRGPDRRLERNLGVHMNWKNVEQWRSHAVHRDSHIR